MNMRIFAILVLSLLPVGLLAASTTPVGSAAVPPVTVPPAGIAPATQAQQPTEEQITAQRQATLQARRNLRERNKEYALTTTLRNTNAKWATRGIALLLSGLYINAQRTYSKAGASSRFYLSLERAGLTVALEKCENEEKKQQLQEQLTQVQRQLDRLESTRSSASTKRYIYGTGALISIVLALWQTFSSPYTPNTDDVTAEIQRMADEELDPS